MDRTPKPPVKSHPGKYLCRGVHPPEAMMHFPPVSDPPYFRQILRLCGKSKKFNFFPKQFFGFHRPQISNFHPIFPVSVYFPSVSRNLLFSPYFEKCLPLISKNSPVFYILHVHFVSPYFDHDAFMHHPMHVLDSSVRMYTCTSRP